MHAKKNTEIESKFSTWSWLQIKVSEREMSGTQRRRRLARLPLIIFPSCFISILTREEHWQQSIQPLSLSRSACFAFTRV